MLELGILKTWNSTTYKAGVQLVGSLTTYLDDISVSVSIPSSAMVVGNYVLVAIPGGNPRDACIVASWPQGSSGGGGGGATDHGELDGLADDDHSQYLNTARHDVTARHPLGTVVPHESALNNLGDVNVPSPSDDDALYWDNAASKWKAKAASGGGSSVIWKDASVRVMSDTNRTVTKNWTDLDLTGYTSANAKIAILHMLLISDITGPGDNVSRLLVRKNGTYPPYYPRIFIGTTYPDKSYVGMIAMCGLDASQILEYRIEIAAGAQMDSFLELLGYIE